MIIDLHVHTNASDGLHGPAGIVRMAGQLGVGVVAVADHDTVDGIDEAVAAGGVRVVPAVEINAYSGDVECHILGYFISHRDPALRRALAALREARLRRMRLIVEKLGLLGVEVRAEEILALAGAGTVGRPHIARALVGRGHAASIREAFDRYIGDGKPAYAPRSKMTPAEAIGLVRRAGGVAVLAHPGLWGADGLVEQLAGEGIEGIEVYANNHSERDVVKYRDIARRLGLIMTGGSDYHGWSDNPRDVIGGVSTPPEEFARLEEAARRAGTPRPPVEGQ
ncbi:MAG: PHP domain-containing protein [bacterium]|nr:PHP domain-containing protein [bacterium]